ncbi:MAG: 3-dehydroquinate synthase [Candidatus Binatia bacterium]|nr:MAG: 3-dehydroquinate synthase [Candidatus Binatia bacterium]
MAGKKIEETLTVSLGERSYPIYIGKGILGEVGAKLRELRCGTSAAVVTNNVVAPLYLGKVVRSLRDHGFETTTIEIPDGEEHKNLAWLTFVYDRLVDARLERNSPILALGGGVVGDLAGFAAATFLRGVPFVQLPTTLVAQVDASVGGKTGVNHPEGKNLIGAFYQPRFVLVDVRTLKTLPKREFTAGLAEVVKYGVILDPDLFALVEERLPALQALDEDLLVQVVRTCCAIKALVVAEDERESGFRAVLNFGHTVGHAVESLTEYRRYLHGEAVAIGMAFAARFSAARGLCKQETAERVVRLLKRAHLPVTIPKEIRGKPLALAVETDKKIRGGKIRFVALEDIGRTRFLEVDPEEIGEFSQRSD